MEADYYPCLVNILRRVSQDLLPYYDNAKRKRLSLDGLKLILYAD
jgi:hypothetical protein